MQGQPQTVHVTPETVDHLFERVMVPLPEHGGAMEPGWRCRACGWTIATIGLPHDHVCAAQPNVAARRVKVMVIAADLLLGIAKNPNPVTVKVTDGLLPPDARLVGIQLDNIQGTIMLAVESEEFPMLDGNEVLPQILPAVNITQLTVVPVEDPAAYEEAPPERESVIRLQRSRDPE